MKFDALTKEQLIELLESIKDDVVFIEKCSVDSRKDFERTSMQWSQGRADAYEQSAKWLNERFAKYESTRP